MSVGAALIVALLVAVPGSAGGAAAEATAGGDPGPELARARSLLRAGPPRRALEEARSLAGRFPGDARVQSLVGEALFRNGLLEQVAAVLEAPVAGPDPPARALMILARLRDAEGRREEAVELMERAVRGGPDDCEILFQAAEVSGTRARAVEWLEQYLDSCAEDDADRIEAARGTVRVFRRLGERPIWIASARPERLELPLVRLWDPETGRTLGYVIRAQLGSAKKPTPLLLDSGSTGLFVIERVARKAGFERLADKTSFDGGGSQRHPTRRGFFPSFGIGGLSFEAALSTTTVEELEPTGRYHGILGLAVFNGYRVTIDLAAAKLVLEPLGEPVHGSPYWDVGGQWLVRGAERGGRGGLFLFDTGATRTLVATRFIEGLDDIQLRLGASIRGFGGVREGARLVDGVELLFQDLRVGPRGLAAADLSLRSALSGVEVSGFLGLDALDRRKIEIDTRRQSIRVSAP